MKALTALRHAMIALLIFLLAAPCEVLGQQKGGSTFTEAELSQMLAPIALYPDSLLANILVASTFPLEIVAADRWVKKNKGLKGEQLNAALDKMSWDLSVKALVPFPEVLAMMSEKLEWTEALGAAFLAQEKDVMGTVQKLRARARDDGNLKTSNEQKVIVQENTIAIQPANPTTIYVPSYNPQVVYGAWPYPSYPPYPYYPYGGAVVAGAIGFAAGVAVGAAWNNGWGHWNWGGGTLNVNVNRNFNINGNRVSHYQSGRWNQAARTGSISARNSAARWKGSAAGSRNNFRGRTPAQLPSGARGPRASQRSSAGAARHRASQLPSQRPRQGLSGRPSASSVQRGLQQGRRGGAFQGMGNAGYTRMSSQRGFSSRQASMRSFGSRGYGGAGRRGGFSRGGRGVGGGGRGGRSGGRRR